MKRNQLSAACVQELFDSARNAGAKGLAQYFTPPEVARSLALALPRHRPVIADLHCGRGALLETCANSTTEHLLGCDIDSVSGSPLRLDRGEGSGVRCRSDLLSADLCKLLPFLSNTQCRFDLLTLNPPWDLHQFREPMRALLDSDCDAVRAAFAQWDGRTPRECIDSCVAALCIALDRASEFGEGFLIMNRAAAFRLILDRESPHHDLARHVWCVVELDNAFGHGTEAIALFFAREEQAHPSAPRTSGSPLRLDRGEGSGVRCRSGEVSNIRSIPLTSLDGARDWRQGVDVRSASFAETDTVLKWRAAADGYKSQIANRKSKNPWNIWLAEDGTLRTGLSLYEQHDVHVDKSEAEELHKLNGQRPVQLVLQRPTRDLLKKHAGLSGPPLLLDRGEGSGVRCRTGEVSQPSQPSRETPTARWKVAPAVLEAVNAALLDYDAQRAPLWPLTPTMRLGWLDENDTVLCVKNLSLSASDDPSRPSRPSPTSRETPCFLSGHRYPLKTSTVTVTRAGQKRNMEGEFEDVELSGKELLFVLTDGHGEPRQFRIVRPNEVLTPLTSLSPQRGEGLRVRGGQSRGGEIFPLELLLAHFEIPDVPDIARVQPAQYQLYRARLLALEAITERKETADERQ